MIANTKPIDILAVRRDFPLLSVTNRNKPVVYLDSGSSAQKPQSVINAMADFYRTGYANIHRGIYELSEKASQHYENVRAEVKTFINAKSADEIVFVRGTTEAINLVAHSFGRTNLKAGDEILVSEMEHHSNIVPWHLLREQIGVILKVIPITDDGEINMDAYRALFSPRTKVVAITQASNVLGTINQIKLMTQIAHDHDAVVVVDGAQAVPHMPVDVSDLDCDFYAFSAHKLYGPSGVGVLYGKQKWLEQMQPYQGGGGMIESVTFEQITFAKSPHKFEAGTPDIAGVIGLSAAMKYIDTIGKEAIFTHEQALLHYTQAKLAAIPGLRIIGTAKSKVGVISFVLEGIHPHDIRTVLDHEGIAIRAGHHCAQPIMQRFNVPATVRVSLGIYNTEKDIDALVDAIQLTKRLFA